MSTLMDFRYKRKYVAGNGVDGQGNRRTRQGRRRTWSSGCPGAPWSGTPRRGEIIWDMSDARAFRPVPGAAGAAGATQHFATPTRQVPRFAKAGLPGQEPGGDSGAEAAGRRGPGGLSQRGQVHPAFRGHPRPSPRSPTTTSPPCIPNLGVVYVDEGVSFVMADIPGIIEGAGEGAGLGHDFLRHVDRCRLLDPRGGRVRQRGPGPGGGL